MRWGEVHLLHRMKLLSNIGASVSWLAAGIKPRTHQLAAQCTTTELINPLPCKRCFTSHRLIHFTSYMCWSKISRYFQKVVLYRERESFGTGRWWTEIVSFSVQRLLHRQISCIFHPPCLAINIHTSIFVSSVETVSGSAHISCSRDMRTLFLNHHEIAV